VCGRKFFNLLSVSTLKFERVWKRVLRVVEEFQHSSIDICATNSFKCLRVSCKGFA